MTAPSTPQVTSGLQPTGAPVFWAKRNPGIRYVRCELPARAIGGRVDNLDEAVREGRFHLYQGPHVFQIPASRFELDQMKAAAEMGCLVAAEFDDDYTRWEERYAAAASTATNKWTKKELESRDQWSPSVELARRAAAFADAVIVTTPVLQKAYGACSDNVHVCRNSVLPAHWPEPQRNEDAPFRALFAAAHNPSDFAQVRKAMVWLAAQDGAEAVVIGGQIDWPGVTHIPWVANDLEAVRAFMCALAPDVGLRPLEPTRFARGKSDLKILEYAMCGAMSVVAPYEPYKQYGEWQGLVRYARSGNEFIDEMKAAYEDRETVNRLAAETRKWVLASRTIDAEAHTWTSALRLS